VKEILVAGVCLLMAGLWIYGLIDLMRRPADTRFRNASRTMWMLLMLFGGWLGTLIYLAAGRPESA